MRRAVLAVPLVAILAAVAWSVARGVDAEEGVCSKMTAARMLENPAFAHAYAGALGSGDAADVARLEGLLREIRSLHGCAGDEAQAPVAPPAAPRLPPGHPPIRDRASPAAPLFEAPNTIAI
jgi:hypothetical protein